MSDVGAQKASGKARRSELAMKLLEGRARPVERTGCKGPEVKPWAWAVSVRLVIMGQKGDVGGFWKGVMISAG